MLTPEKQQENAEYIRNCLKKRIALCNKKTEDKKKMTPDYRDFIKREILEVFEGFNGIQTGTVVYHDGKLKLIGAQSTDAESIEEINQMFSLGDE